MNENYKAVKRRKRRMLKIATKKLPASVVAALVTGMVSFAIFVALCIVSAVKIGKAGRIAGIIPIILLIANAFAFFISYQNLKKEDVKKGFVSAAAFLNGGMVIIYLVLYLLGFYMMYK